MVQLPETFDCPSCGGPLNLNQAENNLVPCPYCNKNVIVPESLRKPVRHEPVIKIYSEQSTVKNYQSIVGQMQQQQQAVKRTGNVTCLVYLLAVVILIVALLFMVGPGLLTNPIASLASLGIIDPVEATAQAESGNPIAIPGVDVLALSSPTPAFAQELLSFGDKGIGPGMFEDTRSVAVDTEGNIFTAEYQDGRVQKFGPDGKFISMFSVGKKKIVQDIAVSRKGVLFVTVSGEILKYDAKTGESLGQIEYADDHYFENLAVTPEDGLLVVSRGETIIRFDRDEKVTLTIPDAVSTQTEESELNASVGVDGLGNIYVLGSFNNAVLVFSPEGKYLNRFGSAGDAKDQFRAVNDIVVDGKGRVYVADFWGVKVFTTEGRSLGLINVPSGVAFGLAVDDQNRVYLVSNAPKLVKVEIK